MTRADCFYRIADGIIYIIDEDKGNMSVTNDMENVLRDIESAEGCQLRDYIIVYRDSDGRWDRVVGWPDKITFSLLNNNSLQRKEYENITVGH